jgi:acetoin utilization deacetylase AcuC-like enzyme
MLWRRIQNRLRRRLLRSPVSVWYHSNYRLPTASIESVAHIEPRRADLVIQYLLDCGLLERRSVRQPQRVRYSDLARVHSDELLQSLHDPSRLADVFAVDPSDIHVDEILHTFRLACGATLEAARESLRRRGPTLNLLGGFHHAGPDRAAALCPFNDIAVAVAALRDSGFSESVVVLDLDAHPPDGTAECLGQDPRVWIGSLSGCDWGRLTGVDETVLPGGCDDACYLRQLQALLERTPPSRGYRADASGSATPRPGRTPQTPGHSERLAPRRRILTRGLEGAGRNRGRADLAGAAGFDRRL